MGKNPFFSCYSATRENGPCYRRICVDPSMDFFDEVRICVVLNTPFCQQLTKRCFHWLIAQNLVNCPTFSLVKISKSYQVEQWIHFDWLKSKVETIALIFLCSIERSFIIASYRASGVILDQSVII